MPEFEKAQTDVAMIVPHERCRVRWWSEKAKSELTVLADPAYWVSGLYGVAYQMRIHTDVSNTPASFLMGKDGVVRWAHIGTGQRNWADRPSVTQTLEKAREHLSK